MGVFGSVFVVDDVECGVVMNCDVVGSFVVKVRVVIVVSGGIGGNYELVWVVWFEWLGMLLMEMFSGVLVYVDGCMFVIL